MAFPIKTHTVHNLPFHVSYVSVLPDVTQKPKSYVAFTRYTGFRWGSGSPINWLYWLTRCGSQPLQRISASWYRPVHHLGFCALPMLVVACIHTELARRAFSVAAPSIWNSLPRFDCVKTFSLSNATWKPIYSNSLSPPVLHQAPLYLRT